MRTLIVITCLAGGVASAGTVRGERAETLTYALRYAGRAPTVHDGAFTFAVDSVDCMELMYADGTSDYRCVVGASAVKDAEAYLLGKAMLAAGFAVTFDTLATPHVRGENLSCTLSPSQIGDDRYVCTTDVGLAPKKKIKDLVQRVKIEKQH